MQDSHRLMPATHDLQRYVLRYEQDKLTLFDMNDTAFAGLVIDFLTKQHHYRRQHGGGVKQALAKAVGLKAKQTLSVLDTTAGLGVDSFVLACLGAQVTAIERHPLLAALLADGLRRLDDAGDPVAKHLCFIHAEAQTYLPSLAETSFPDVIYLDPMYPSSKKSALHKQSMRLLRELVGDDNDASTVLTTALFYAQQRVVVKRPRLAPLLSPHQPHHQLLGKAARFDIYLPLAADRRLR
jgi:16S rRNA (guanine1516-N2)-methyltransferase